jgi:sarcosine oxidase subunit beta
VKTGNASIVIIGAGVVGASVAYHLTERGARDVRVLEAESGQGRGSTGKATGGIRAQFETDVNILLSLYSLEFFRNWEVDCGYDPKGYLFFATSEEQFGYLATSVEKQKRLGVEDVEIVDAHAIGKIVPGMNCSDIVGGSFGGRDGFIDPLAVMRGFTEGALRRGATLEFGRHVDSIETDAGRVRGVRSGGELIECDSVVLCTGALARKIATTAGVDLPVEPQRRQIVWARTREPLPRNMPMVIDIGSGFHFRPAIDWTEKASTGATQNFDVLFAYPDRDEPPSSNTDFDEAFIAKVVKRARHRAPFLVESEVIPEKCRAGLYENTPDHHAILGRCDVEGLYLACGFSGHGVMHSPATGRALADLILDGESKALDVACLSIDRFSAGRLIHETAFI